MPTAPAGGDEAGRRIADALAELDRLSAGSGAARAPVELDQQAVGRLSRMDALQQQAMAQAEEVRRQQQRRRLLAARTRLGQGDYGLCLDCGEAIAAARLRLDPAAELCIGCAQARER